VLTARASAEPLSVIALIVGLCRNIREKYMNRPALRAAGILDSPVCNHCASRRRGTCDCTPTAFGDQ
jgi:hypothetical protein